MQLSDPPSSYAAGAYIFVGSSQLNERAINSQPSSGPLPSLSLARLSAPAGPLRVIPDSQSLPRSTSCAPGIPSSKPRVLPEPVVTSQVKPRATVAIQASSALRRSQEGSSRVSAPENDSQRTDSDVLHLPASRPQQIEDSQSEVLPSPAQRLNDTVGETTDTDLSEACRQQRNLDDPVPSIEGPLTSNFHKSSLDSPGPGNDKASQGVIAEVDSSGVSSFVPTPPVRNAFAWNNHTAADPSPRSSLFAFQTQISHAPSIQTGQQGFSGRSVNPPRLEPSAPKSSQSSMDDSRPSTKLPSASEKLNAARERRKKTRESSDRDADSLAGPPTRGSSLNPSANSPRPSSAAEKLEALRRERLNKRGSERPQQCGTPLRAASNAPSSNATQSQRASSPVTPKIVAKDKTLAPSPSLVAPEQSRSPPATPAVALPQRTRKAATDTDHYETLVPQARTDGKGLSDRWIGGHDVHEAPRQRCPVRTNPELRDVHAVPIVLGGHQRDQQPQMLYHYRRLVQLFLETARPSKALLAEAQHVIARIRAVVMHPDLDNHETFTQHDDMPKAQAQWDTICSGKFAFLDSLLHALRDGGAAHVAIVAAPGRIIEILQTFLRGIEVCGPSRSSSSSSTVAASVLESCASAEDLPPADVVISMDNTVRGDSSLIRSLRRRGNRWCPLVTLVVPYSVEHVERCLSPSLGDPGRTQALLGGIQQLRDRAGRLEEGHLNARDSAVILARYIRKPEDHEEWPLPLLSTLEGLETQTESEVEPLRHAPDVPSTDKRRLDEAEMDRDDARKKIHLGDSEAQFVAPPFPATFVSPDELECTHVSDSINKLSQPHASRSREDDPSATEEQLRHLVQETQSRLDEHIAALDELQTRFENMGTDLGATALARDAAEERADKEAARRDKLQDEMRTLRGTNGDLKRALHEAQTRLRDQSNPPRAMLEAHRANALSAIAERDRATDRLARNEGELTYVRDMYQRASTAAQQAAAETADLERRLADLQPRVPTAEHAALHRTAVDAYTQQLARDNRYLRAVLRERDVALATRDAEIARLQEAAPPSRASVVGTARATSVSSRALRAGSVGRPSSPVATGAARGRQGSLHPLRNG